MILVFYVSKSFFLGGGGGLSPNQLKIMGKPCKKRLKAFKQNCVFYSKVVSCFYQCVFFFLFFFKLYFMLVFLSSSEFWELAVDPIGKF